MPFVPSGSELPDVFSKAITNKASYPLVSKLFMTIIYALTCGGVLKPNISLLNGS